MVYLITYVYHKNQPNAAKYTSPMNPIEIPKKNPWIHNSQHSFGFRAWKKTISSRLSNKNIYHIFTMENRNPSTPYLSPKYPWWLVTSWRSPALTSTAKALLRPCASLGCLGPKEHKSIERKSPSPLGDLGFEGGWVGDGFWGVDGQVFWC